jgi:hypothetical protein
MPHPYPCDCDDWEISIDDDSIVIEVGIQGAKGAKGDKGNKGDQGDPGGGSNPTALPALTSSALSALRVVTLDGAGLWEYATIANPAHATALLCLLQSATAIGGAAEPLLLGFVSDLAWTWVKDAPIFLGIDGVLTQSAPTAGFMRQVAIATSATQIYFAPQIGIEL